MLFVSDAHKLDGSGQSKGEQASKQALQPCDDCNGTGWSCEPLAAEKVPESTALNARNTCIDHALDAAIVGATDHAQEAVLAKVGALRTAEQ